MAAADPDPQKVRENLEGLAGTTGDELTKLVDAIRVAAIEEAYDYVTGDAPIPSSMVDWRALRLRRICHCAGRPLRTREIEVLFRVGASTARSIDSRMQATYPLEMRNLGEALNKAMRDGASVRGYKDGGNERYRVHFDSRSSCDHAQAVLETARLSKGVEREGDQVLTMPIRIDKVDPLVEILKIPAPK